MCTGRHCATESDVKLKGDKRLYLIDPRERVSDRLFTFRDLMGTEVATVQMIS